MPATSGASGPGTARLISLSMAKWTSAGKSSWLMGMFDTLSRPLAVPPFPKYNNKAVNTTTTTITTAKLQNCKK